MPLGAVILLVVIGIGIFIGHRRRDEIRELRQSKPKSHWKQGHKLYFDYGIDGKPKVQRARKPRIRDIHLVEEDLEEMDGMFGSAGTNPADYE